MSDLTETKENITDSAQEEHHHHHHHSGDGEHHEHHHHGESSGNSKKVKKTRRDRSPVRKELLILAGVLLLLGVGLFAIWKMDQKAPDESVLESMSAAVRESVSDDALYEKWKDTTGEIHKNPVVTYKGKQYRQREDLTTILLMGLDVYKLDERIDHMRNRQQADFLMVIGIDEANKKGFALQVNRDTMTDVMTKDIQGNNAGSMYMQICLSHTYGKDETDACENTLDAVQNLLYGTAIDHYLCTTMDSVEYLNDAVGGVTLISLDDFPGDEELKKGKEVTLLGEKALKYVRARMDMPDDTNLHRMERQQQYLTELRKQCVAKTKEDQGFMLQSLLAVSDNMVSDCRVNELSDIANAAVNFDFGEILSVKGENRMGEEYIEYIADEDALQKQVIDLFYEEVR